MEVTIKLNDNPQLIKVIKEIAKGFNEPIQIKKLKNNYSVELLQAIKEVESGEVIKFKNFDEYKKYMDIANV